MNNEKQEYTKEELKVLSPFDKNFCRCYRSKQQKGIMATLFHKDNTKVTTMRYERYLMSIFLRRRLMDTEVVAFKDGDKTNFSKSNLYLTTSRKLGLDTRYRNFSFRSHMRKPIRNNNSGKTYPLKKFNMVCRYCKKGYHVDKKDSKREYRLQGFCSIVCKNLKLS